MIQHAAQKQRSARLRLHPRLRQRQGQRCFHSQRKNPARPDGLPRGEEGAREIKASPQPDLPLIWSEFNATYDNDVAVTDSIYMGPWLATTISQCDGLAEMMSYWTFSDVFEEQGVVKQPFYGGFGLIAAGGIPKPSFYAFQVLHRLGDQRLDNSNPDVLVTKAKDGSWRSPLEPRQSRLNGAPKTVKLDFKGVKPDAPIAISRVDEQHGNTLALYEKMGSPRYPTRDQIRALREDSRLPDPEYDELTEGATRCNCR